MRHRFHFQALLVALCLMSAPAAAFDNPPSGFTINGQNVPKVVARVNGKPLGYEMLKNQLQVYRMMAHQEGKQPTPQEEVEFAKEALENMVEQELIYQRAKELNIQIPSEAIDKEVAHITQQFPSKELFEAAMKAQGLTPELLRAGIERQLVEEAFMRKEIAPHVNVDDAAVEKYYQDNIKQFLQPERYVVHHIFVAALQADPEKPPKDPASRDKAEHLQKMIEDDARDKIESVLKRLRAGEDFETVAKEVSEDEGSREKGGSLGAIMPGQTLPEIDAAVAKLKPGEFSDVVRSPFGFHIILLKKKIPAGPVPLADVKTDILNFLLQEQMRKSRDAIVEELRKKADIQLFYP